MGLELLVVVQLFYQPPRHLLVSGLSLTRHESERLKGQFLQAALVTSALSRGSRRHSWLFFCGGALLLLDSLQNLLRLFGSDRQQQFLLFFLIAVVQSLPNGLKTLIVAFLLKGGVFLSREKRLTRQFSMPLSGGAGEEGVDADRTLLRSFYSRRVEQVLMVLGLGMVLDNWIRRELPSKERGWGELKKSIFLLDIFYEIKWWALALLSLYSHISQL